MVTSLALLLGSCSTTQGDRSDFFGYNNNPKQEESEVVAVNEEDGWSNPLNSEYEGQDNFTINYTYSNMPPSFIPVVVPWYDSPYNWYHQPFSGVYMRFGYSNYAFYDWYSPFYMHSPIYYNPYIYYGGNRWWDWYPYPYGGGSAYNDYEKPKKTYQIRDFGPNRGSYNSDGTPYAGGSGSTSGKSSGRTVSKTNTTDKSGFDNGAQLSNTIIYKPKSNGSFGTKSDFGKINSSRSSAKTGYSKDATNQSSGNKNSGFGSSSKSSSSSSGSSSSGSSSSGSSSSESGSKSSSSRSSSRSK